MTAEPNRASLISLALAAAAAIAAVTLPLCSQMTTNLATGGLLATTEFRRVHCELSAYQVLIAWLPVVIGGVVVAARNTVAAGIARYVAAAMLVGFVIVAGFSIGLLYAPAAAAMILAATSSQPAERKQVRSPVME